MREVRLGWYGVILSDVWFKLGGEWDREGNDIWVEK